MSAAAMASNVDTCSICGNVLGNKSHQKIGLSRKLRGEREETMEHALFKQFGVSVTPNKSCHICGDCFKSLEQATTGKRLRDVAVGTLKGSARADSYLGQKLQGKSPNVSTPAGKRRAIVTSTPIHKHSPKKKIQPSKTRSGCVRSACIYIRQSHYKEALKCLNNSSVSFRRTLKSFVKDIIQKELRHLMKQKSIWSIERQHSSSSLFSALEEFTWDKALDETNRYCPTMSAVLEAMFSTPAGKYIRGRKRPTSLKPFVGTVIGLTVFGQQPRTMKLFQQMTALQMWLSGCSRDAFTRFNHLGICMGINATRNCVDHIRTGFDDQIKQLQERLSTPAEVPKTTRRKLFASNIDPRESAPGYSIVFDNVNQKTRARYNTSTRSNQMKNMVQAYAAIDRVDSMHLDDTPPEPETILNIPTTAYMPSESDIEILRAEYRLTIQRVLVKLVEPFQTLAPNIPDRITHPYLYESKQKSHLIPLGVMEKDETRIADMIDIMDSYMAYVPGNYKPTPILLFGDALSCERAHDAQTARCTGSTEWQRLTGLVPAIQEWHKRGLLLGDIYHLLYDAKSARDIGTLYGIRNKFRHNNVKSDVMQCFNYANDLMNFTTDAYILGAGLHVLEELQCEKLSLECQFKKTVDFIMELAFHPSHIIYKTCNLKDTWCFCQTEDEDGEFIQCDSDTCPNGKWFHLSCVKLSPETVPDGKWHCSTECRNKKTANTTDGKLNYTKSVLWHGIGQKVRHDALREADGTRIISHWRFDMLRFHANHHPKYFIVGHRLLTDVNGGSSDRIKHQLMWNRTVNVRGGYGNNLEMDLQMEFFNKEYKGEYYYLDFCGEVSLYWRNGAYGVVTSVSPN